MRGEIEIKKGFSITPQNFYVYLHIRESNDTVFYVGKGTKHRWCTSFSRSKHWKHTASKHGVICKIVAHNLTTEEALILEKKLIASYGRQDQKTGCLVNLTDGGDGVVNYVWTDEHRKKVALASTGRRHTDEFKQLVSSIHKGKVLSLETRAKISKARAGSKWSVAQREAAKDKENPLSKEVLCLNSGIVYKSVAHVAKELSLDNSGVSKVCYGRRKHYKNLRFKFLDEYLSEQS